MEPGGRRTEGEPLPARTLRTALVFALAACAIASAAAAAEWLEARAGLCTIAGPPGSAAAFRAIAGRAPAMLEQVETHLGVRAAAPYRIYLITGAVEDTAVLRLDRSAPEWAAGYLLPEARIGAIRVERAAQYPYGTPEAVLAHEATHMLLHDAVGDRIPLWFNEGVATWEGRRWTLEDAWIVSSTVLTTDLPALADLDARFHGDELQASAAYAASFAFVSWSAHRHGPEFVRNVLRETRGMRFEAAWRRASGGATLAEDEAAWRRVSLLRYRWLPILTGSSTLWAAVAGLGALAGALRRRRARLARERWGDEDEAAAEDDGEWAKSPAPEIPAPPEAEEAPRDPPPAGPRT